MSVGWLASVPMMLGAARPAPSWMGRMELSMSSLHSDGFEGWDAGL